MKYPLQVFTLRLLVALGLASVLLGCRAETQSRVASALPYSLSPPPQAVVGDLGGVPVAIPREYARLVEYDGDPHWLAQRKGPPPVRDNTSKLVSFGILVHLPTMKPLTKDNEEAYQKRGRRDVEWLNSSISAGSVFYKGEDSFPDPYTSDIPGREFYKRFDYESVPDMHGMKAWRATREIALDLVLDDLNRRHSMSNHHLYFGYEGEKIIALIKCGSGLTSAPGGRNLCSHSFVLWPEIKAEVEMQYSVDILSDWRINQQKMRDLMLSFRMQPAKANTVPLSGQPAATSPTFAKP